MKRYLLAVSASIFAVAGIAANEAGASALKKLKPHRAVYDLSLKEASDRSGITAMNGRIVYEMTGSACEGFAVRFRFLTNVETSRKSFTSDQRSTTFESADGKDFSFVTQSYLNGQLEQELRGSAERTDGNVEVAISKPQKQQVKLGSAIFMTAHIGQLIEAAKADETIFTARVFDGSENGDELVDTTAVIGKRKQAVSGLRGEPKEVTSAFEGLGAWPMSVSYFSTSAPTGEGERLPTYQVSFYLHENGVSRDLKMRYDDYSLHGELKKVEFLPTPACN